MVVVLVLALLKEVACLEEVASSHYLKALEVASFLVVVLTWVAGLSLAQALS